MLQRPEYGEGHPERICCYCGGFADTVDHVPSKVFLDKPYPENLPVVPCCKKCNEQFSLDEEYVAVLFECVRCQSFDPHQFKREKIRKIVEHNPALLLTVKKTSSPMLDGRFSINPENARMKKVLTKLIVGHLRFEGLDQWFLHEDLDISFYQDIHANQDLYNWFYFPMFSGLLPEVGSRGLMALVEHENTGSLWFTVQPNQYEYSVAPDNSEVRIIIQDYFAVRGLIY